MSCPKWPKRFEQAKAQGKHIQNFFREFLGNFISERTRLSYLRDLATFSGFLAMGGEKLSHPSEIRSYHLSLYRDWMMEQGLAPATVGRRMVAVRSFVKWALGQKLIDHDPLQAVKLPKVQTLSPTVAFDDDEVRSMIDAPDVETFSGNTHRLVLVLLFYLGPRRAELAQIKMEDIVKERGHTALLIHGKGGKKRLVPLSEAVMEEIEAYGKRLSSLTGRTLEGGDFLIQTDRKGKNLRPCDGSTIYRIVKRYAAGLGITKRVGAHSCRATVISHLLDTQKRPIRDVADFAGHRQTSTTERYDKKRKGLDDSAAYEVDYFERASDPKRV
ncbi:MAG: tyrosine-type recombinase/integrase [Bacteriovoracales bacterium]|nr:tyrosine-type recombinase/integrase [Bacteriovoracales bacterium]